MDVIETLRRALQDRYRLERELGQGGMATVYLAEDLRHHRKVALKAMRPELAATLGAERFLREIETTAQLTHPHILPLLDSGEADGTLFYVMPYVEGESLRDRITREKQLPLEDALRIAREVADALGYAHSHGVIHRDIKPENILLESGHAVVADFGIARAVSVAGGERLTGTGLAVGTPAYMSPEQAAGVSDLDGRSDLYSLGCVLYEMLSGETPYTGATPQAIFAKKLSAPVPLISVVRETVPAGVEAALTKALARTPADRWATAAAFATALAGTDAQTPRRTGAQRVAAGRWRLVAAGIIGVAAIALAAAWWLVSRPLNITVSDLTQVTSEPGREWQPAISPDGKEVAYPAGRQLVIRATENPAAGGGVRSPDTAFGYVRLPVWSADGDIVRFQGCRRGECAWYEMGKLGGAIRRATLPTRARRWLAWSPDGARVAYFVADTLFTAGLADTVAPRRIAVQPPREDRQFPHSLAWSPDGKLLVYVDGNELWLFNGNVAGSSIWVVRASGGTPRRVAGGGSLNTSPAWLDSRHLLFVSDRDGARAVYVAEVRPEGPRGAPRIIPGVADPHTISYSRATRRLAWAKFTFRENIWSWPLRGTAPVSIRDGVRATTGNEVSEFSDVSPDGRWLVFDSNRRGNLDLFKVPVAGGEAVPLTDTPWGESDPHWSPDGTEISYHADVHRSGGTATSIMVMPAEGGTAPVALTTAPGLNGYARWSPDGRSILFWSNRTGKGATWILTRDRVGGPWRPEVQVSGCGEESFDWAPDGDGPACLTGAGSIVSAPSRGRVPWRLDLKALGLVGIAQVRFSLDRRTVFVQGQHRDGRRGVWSVPVSGGALSLIMARDDPLLDIRGGLSAGRDRFYAPVPEYESDIWVADLKW